MRDSKNVADFLFYKSTVFLWIRIVMIEGVFFSSIDIDNVFGRSYSVPGYATHLFNALRISIATPRFQMF